MAYKKGPAEDKLHTEPFRGHRKQRAGRRSATLKVIGFRVFDLRTRHVLHTENDPPHQLWGPHNAGHLGSPQTQDCYDRMGTINLPPGDCSPKAQPPFLLERITLAMN